MSALPFPWVLSRGPLAARCDHDFDEMNEVLRTVEAAANDPHLPRSTPTAFVAAHGRRRAGPPDAS